MTTDESVEVAQARADGHRRGYDVAAARAESRVALGLPLERGVEHEEMTPEQAAFEYAWDDGCRYAQRSAESIRSDRLVNEMGRCSGCRFWDGWDDLFDPPVTGTCGRIVPSVLTPDDQESPDPDPNGAALTAGAELSTGRDFGCVLFQAKD